MGFVADVRGVGDGFGAAGDAAARDRMETPVSEFDDYCYHGADECPDKCMCPCSVCYLLRTDAYTGSVFEQWLCGPEEPREPQAQPWQ